MDDDQRELFQALGKTLGKEVITQERSFMDRLRDVLVRHGHGGAGDICGGVIDEVRAFGSGDNQDDLTLVVLKRSAVH